MNRANPKFKTTCFTFLLVLICIIFGEVFTINYGWILYLVQLLLFVQIVFTQKNNNVLVFSPSFITLVYLGLNFTFGHYVVVNNIGFNSKYFDAFQSYESIKFITVYFLICNQIVFLSLPLKKIKQLNFTVTNERKLLLNDKIYLVVLFSLLTIADFINLDLSFIGGKGDFSYAVKLSLVILIVLNVSNYQNKLKYLLYVLLSLLFVVTNYDSKREFFYVIILIFFIEIIKRNINFKLSIKGVVIAICGFLSIVYIVIISSIMRGYGNYDVSGPLDATKYTIDYVKSDFAQFALVNNFELNTVYGNGSNAVNYIFTGSEKITYGSTFLKFLFLPIPRSVFPDKPQSMIEIYTNLFDPNFRSVGGSLPVILYSEAFWNFSLLAFLFIFLFYYFMNKLYLIMVRKIKLNNLTFYLVFMIYLYVTIIQCIRGSGLELWLLYPVVSIPFVFLLINLSKLIKR